MARITQEQIEMINEIYRETKNKSLTAKKVGVSVASVNKYLQDDYVPKAKRADVPKFEGTINGAEEFLNTILNSENLFKTFYSSLSLTEEEKIDLKKLQEEIYL